MAIDTIRTASPAERPGLKGDEIVRLARTDIIHQPAATEYAIKVEIRAIERIPNGVKIAARAWNARGQQLGFGPDGSIDIETFRLLNPPLLVLDSAGSITRTPPASAGIASYKLKEDPERAILDHIAHASTLAGTTKGVIIPGSIGRTVTVINPEAGSGTSPIDGNAQRGVSIDETWSTLRNGAGDTHDDTATLDSCPNFQSSSTTDQWSWQVRGIYGFDTSVIGSDVISQAVLSIFGHSTKANAAGDIDSVLCSFTPNDAANLANGDYDIGNFGSTEFGRTTYASWGSGYNDVTLNASGEAHIDTGGETFFGQWGGQDFDDAEPSPWPGATQRSRLLSYFADDASNDPKLTITHAPGTAIRDLIGVGLIPFSR